jgi:hypothetical protein
VVTGALLDPNLAVEDAILVATVRDLAHLLLDVLLAEDSLLRADSAVAAVLEGLDMAHDDLLRGLGDAIGVTAVS